MSDSPYTTIVQDDAPVLFYKFDNTTNVTNLGTDGSGNNGLFSRTGVLAFSFVDTTYSMLKFPTNFNCVYTQGSGTVATNDNTVELWFVANKIIFTNTTNKTILWGKYAYSGTINPTQVLFIENGKIKLYNAGQTHTFTCDTDIYPDKLYHVVVTFSSDTIKIYINGHIAHYEVPGFDPRYASSASLYDGFGSMVQSGAPTTFYSTDNYSSFVGLMGEMAVYESVMEENTINDHYEYGFGSGFDDVLNNEKNISMSYRIYRNTVNFVNLESIYYPCDSLDNATLYTQDTTIETYDDYIANFILPDHYYLLNSTGATESDQGTATAVDLTNQNDAATGGSIVTGATHASVADTDAKSFSGHAGSALNSTAICDADFGFGTEPINFSIAFWLKETDYSSDQDGIMGHGLSSAFGFNVFIQHKKLYFEKKYNSNKYVVINNEGVAVNTWAFYTITVDTAGRMVMYVNGKQVDSNGTNGRGMKLPSNASDFTLGISPGFERKIGATHIDELMVLDRVLTKSEIKNIYNGALVGSVTNTITSGTGISAIPVPTRTGFLNYLSDKKEITDFVVSYIINQSLDSYKDTAKLSIKKDWYDEFVKTDFRPNDYIIIQERYTDSNGIYDSGWVDVGHFIISGPAGTSVTSEGSNSVEIALEGINRLLDFEIAMNDVTPDKVLVPKRAMELRSVNTYEYRFGLRRPGSLDTDSDETKWFRNWADYPSAKLWSSEFRAFTTSLDKKDFDATVGSEIRLRSGLGSVQALYGEGVIRVDKDYYEDAVADNGMGNPDYDKGGIKGEVHRFYTDEDLEYTTITSVSVVSGKTQIVFSSNVVVEKVKTIIIKSGNSKGRFYKIRKI